MNPPKPGTKETPGQFLKRKQATFGSSYSFGAQTSIAITTPENTWPTAVQMALDDARNRVDSEFKNLYNVVHTNWYPDGSAGLAPHSDNEDQMVAGLPIFSYTLLSQPGNPRGFQIYNKTEYKRNKKAPPIEDIQLNHGDLLIMAGEMQDHYMHGVKASTAKKFNQLKRINLTVRAWKQS
tara:strand:- start:185 stop:724 length:540 start_codon:yes stop_codon:yes gene_type:complete